MIFTLIIVVMFCVKESFSCFVAKLPNVIVG